MSHIGVFLATGTEWRLAKDSLEQGPSRARYFPHDNVAINDDCSRAVVVNSNVSRGKYLARERPSSRQGERKSSQMSNSSTLTLREQICVAIVSGTFGHFWKVKAAGGVQPVLEWHFLPKKATNARLSLRGEEVVSELVFRILA